MTAGRAYVLSVFVSSAPRPSGGSAGQGGLVHCRTYLHCCCCCCCCCLFILNIIIAIVIVMLLVLVMWKKFTKSSVLAKSNVLGNIFFWRSFFLAATQHIQDVFIPAWQSSPSQLWSSELGLLRRRFWSIPSPAAFLRHSVYTLSTRFTQHTGGKTAPVNHCPFPPWLIPKWGEATVYNHQACAHSQWYY